MQLIDEYLAKIAKEIPNLTLEQTNLIKSSIQNYATACLLDNKVTQELDAKHISKTRTCRLCDGKGSLVIEDVFCSACKGTGVIRK